jgi:hypothetical protein
MKKTLFIALSVALFSFNEPQNQKHLYEDDSIKCAYETKQGRLDGLYSSYYKTGQKKAEGKFENNYRIGKWTVWDSTGRIRMQRSYSDPFTFKRLIPKVATNNAIDLLGAPEYSIKYNNDGFIEYFYLRERAVVWAKRIWRFATPKNNPLIFDEYKLFSILNKNITPYQNIDTELKSELLPTNIDTSSVRLIGYKIDEDFFFDNERLVSETRIIAICPVVVNRNTKDTIDLYWINYHDIRKYLAQEKINQVGLPTKIKTLDDLFFYRYFYGQIYKEANIYDKPIATYKKENEVDKEAERIELNLIESEHDIWIRFTK